MIYSTRYHNLLKVAVGIVCSFFLIISYGQDTIYIDPLYIGNYQNGSISYPYSSWNKIKQARQTVYLQKRGSTDTIDHIFFTSSAISLGAYGEGEKPVVYCKTKEVQHGIVSWKKSNIKIQNIEVIAPEALSCIYFNSGNINCLIDSCIVHESKWGIRITSGGNLNHSIKNTEVYNILEDGIFVQDAEGIEIYDCHIHDVNLEWKPPYTPEEVASGDGIQFSRCTKWHVHHNVIDRSNSGNKFCFISNNPKQSNCVFEFNELISPKVNGSCIYLGSGSHLIIRHNKFYGTMETTGVFHHTDNLEIYYNIFCNLKNGVLSYNNTTCKIFNNVFYFVNYGVKGDNVFSFNNIFDNHSYLQVPYSNVKNLIEENNHYTMGYNSSTSTSGDPMFLSPKNFDFQLSPKSPCINSGIPNSSAQDINGSNLQKEEKTNKDAYKRPIHQ